MGVILKLVIICTAGFSGLLGDEMYLTIEATPILKGKEAKRFMKLANDNRNKCISRKEIKHILKTLRGK